MMAVDAAAATSCQRISASELVVRTWSRSSLVILATLTATVAPAQSRGTKSFDVNVGIGGGWGGRGYRSDAAVAGELTLGFRAHPDRTTARINAATIGGQFVVAGRGGLIVRARGETLRVASVGVGVRLR
jgi:hypothetical protein